MRPTRAAVRASAAVLVLLAVSTGCSQVQDTAQNAAGAGAAKATDAAKQAARDQVLSQVCGLTAGSGPLADGQLSAQEKAAVTTVASAAEQAGVPAKYTDPLQTVASAQGAAAVQEAVQQLTAACANR